MFHAKNIKRLLGLIRKGTGDPYEIFASAEQLETDGQSALAEKLYRTWLRHLPKHSLPTALIWFKLGALLSKNKNHAATCAAYEAARDVYLRATSLTPKQRADFMILQTYLGREYTHLKEDKKAIAQWREVVRHADPAVPMERETLVRALNWASVTYHKVKQYPAVLESVDKSLFLEPDQPEIIARLLETRLDMCLWPACAPLHDITPEAIRRSAMAFTTINLSDDPAVQLARARSATEVIPTDFPPLDLDPRGYRHERIRIGYASSDFRNHPVARLIVDVLELHDRNRFDVYAFDWSEEEDSALRQRIVAACGERFIRIEDLDELESAQIIRKHEIDILIDLQGLTKGCRPAIFAHRPAPIQITYLGLPATTSIPGIDYILADRFLIPEEYTPHYAEKPLYLPEVFQPGDTKRVHAPIPSRAEYGLPEEGFVFCCFNSDHKYNPEMFDAWARILARTPGSVLWLSVSNPFSEKNLTREALERGIDENRLFFAQRTGGETYLARLAMADLFLDTFPFNAGATANDALWMGLPLLTRAGRSFGSRMGGALLTSAGIEELIAHDLADYEDKAVALAQDPERYQRLRARCGELRTTSVLFDMPRFTRNLENILVERLEQSGA